VVVVVTVVLETIDLVLPEIKGYLILVLFSVLMVAPADAGLVALYLYILVLDVFKTMVVYLPGVVIVVQL
jgi:hypothetical protein